MGPVERMLLEFCTKITWIDEYDRTRSRLVKRMISRKEDPELHTLISTDVWRCFYRRQPDAMRSARGKSRTIQRLLGQFEAEDAAAEASASIDAVLSANRIQ